MATYFSFDLILKKYELEVFMRLAGNVENHLFKKPELLGGLKMYIMRVVVSEREQLLT